jgi:hypothetical protein
MLSPPLPAPAGRACAKCGNPLADNDSQVLTILTNQLWCVGCSPLAFDSPRHFVRCKAEKVEPGHVLAYRDGPRRWRGIAIIDVKTEVAEIGGLQLFRVHLFLATGQVLEVAPGDLVPLRPAPREAQQ